eukprot:1155805-Pelagomonas_calceolata.AAC.2
MNILNFKVSIESLLHHLLVQVKSTIAAFEHRTHRHMEERLSARHAPKCAQFFRLNVYARKKQLFNNTAKSGVDLGHGLICRTMLLALHLHQLTVFFGLHESTH